MLFATKQEKIQPCDVNKYKPRKGHMGGILRIRVCNVVNSMEFDSMIKF